MKKILSEMTFAEIRASIEGFLAGVQITLAKSRYAGASVGAQSYNGLFMVKYNDGELSQRFDYKTAMGYAEIFGGRVVHAKSQKVCWVSPSAKLNAGNT
jgi:hypothetical protein